MKKLIAATITLLAVSICGCGGGGGGAAPAPAAAPTTAVVKVSTVGQAGTLVQGVGVTVNLPPGVSVSTDGQGAVNAGVVTATGAASGHGVLPTYTAATRKLAVVVGGDQTTFGMGEFVTVNCVIAAGSSPVPTDFTLSDFSPGSGGSAVAGVTSTYTVTIQ